MRKGHRYKEVSRGRERGRGSPGIHSVLLIHIAIWIIDRAGRGETAEREKGRVTSQKRKKECRAADPSGGRGRDLREDRGAGLGHRVERADMSMHRLQSTLVSQAKQGCRRVCMCVYVSLGVGGGAGTGRPVKSLPIAS